MNLVKMFAMFLLIKLASTAYRICLCMALGGDVELSKLE